MAHAKPADLIFATIRHHDLRGGNATRFGTSSLPLRFVLRPAASVSVQTR